MENVLALTDIHLISCLLGKFPDFAYFVILYIGWSRSTLKVQTMTKYFDKRSSVVSIAIAKLPTTCYTWV